MINEEIAKSYATWAEYCDPDGFFSEHVFNALTHEERVKILEECFGKDDEKREEDEDRCSCGEGWREYNLPNGVKVCQTCAYDYGDMKYDERKEEGW